MNGSTGFYDAYAHVGLPRFASAEDAWSVLQHYQIEAANMVLFPGSPDFASALEVRKIAGDRVRLIGIPYGKDDPERRRYAEQQIAWGVSGLRLMPFEIEPHKIALQVMGEAGRWLFAINPYQNESTAAALLAWLNQYPQGRIVSPHFLQAGTIGSVIAQTPSMAGLFDHPRFFAIFSRQGGAGDGADDPYESLHPWVEGVAGRMGWDRLMWGSEFPVLYWRNELIDEAQTWIQRLLPRMSGDEYAKFTRQNTRRLFFEEPSPAIEDPVLPEWVESVKVSGHANYFGAKALKIPAKLHQELMHGYFQSQNSSHPERFGDYLVQQLSQAVND